MICFGIITELVPDPVPEPLLFCRPRIVTARFKGKVHMHAAIPAADPFSFIDHLFIRNVETVAGRAKIRARAATDALG